MPGIVASCIPGRIRLRHKIFRDREIAAALAAAVEASGAEASIEINSETGSALIKYKPEMLPPLETLRKRILGLAASFPDIGKLRARAAFYQPKDRQLVLDAIERLREALPAILAR